MTQISRPWTGRTSEGAAGDAGPYSSSQWQQTWETWQGQNRANRGVLRDVDNELEVLASSPADTNVKVQTGSASVQGIWYYSDAVTSVAIAANSSGSTRIDVIVLTADYTAQTVRVAVVQGTPAAGVPALTQSTGVLWQIPLAYVTLASGFTSIAQSAITDLREYANIPSAIGFDVTNDAAVTLEIGSAVIWDSAGTDDINTTTTPGHFSAAGIIEKRVAASGEARVIVVGIVPVLCDEAVAIGDYLSTSSTAGQAQKNVGGRSIGRVLTANTGAGTRCLAYINVPIEENVPYDSGWYAVTSATTYTKAHGLPNAPRYIEVWHSAVAAPGAGDELVRVTHVSSSAGGGNLFTYDCIGVDATNVYVQTGIAGSAAGTTIMSSRRNSNTGYHRILAWA